MLDQQKTDPVRHADGGFKERWETLDLWRPVEARKEKSQRVGFRVLARAASSSVEMKSKRKAKSALFHAAIAGGGDDRIKARVRKSKVGESLKKRSETLLVDYRRLRKANTFVDKRIGEGDAALTPEEKGLMRFRAERIREAKIGRSKFDLSEENVDELTHLGRKIDYNEEGRMEYMGEVADDYDDQALEEILDGMQTNGQEGRQKSRKEVFEEIMTKSKFYRAQKAKQTMDDANLKDEMDKAFGEVVDSNKLAKMVYPKGLKMLAKPEGKEDPSDTKYDKATRMLLFGPTAAAGNPAKREEESAEQEKLKLEKLESDRLKRMRGEEGALMENGNEPKGGYAARRKRQKQEERELSDQDQEDSEDTENEVIYDPAERKGSDDQSKAGRRDPLQEEFQALTQKLMTDYEGEGGDDASDESLASEPEKEQSTPKNASTNESGSDSGSQDLSDDEWEAEFVGKLRDMKKSSRNDSKQQWNDQNGREDEDTEQEAPASQCDANPEPLKISSCSEPNSDSELEELSDSDMPGFEAEELENEEAFLGDISPESDCKAVSETSESVREGGRQFVQDGAVKEELPFTFPSPQSYETFAEWVGGRSERDLCLVISRIRQCNHVDLIANGKIKLQEFYAVLSQHFAMLAGQHPVPLPHLDAMIQPLLEISREVPFYAAALARARLSNMQEKLTDALSGESSRNSNGWPPSQAILLMKLFSVLFPVTDKVHSVTTPLILLISQYIVQCPVDSGQDLATGLFLSAMLVRIISGAKRYAPEPLAFFKVVLENALAGGLIEVKGSQTGQAFKLGLKDVLSPGVGDGFYERAGVRMCLVGIALHGVETLAKLWRGVVCFPEIFSPIVPLLEEVGLAAKLSKDLETQRSRVCGFLRTTAASISKSRRPLVQKVKMEAPLVKQFNPRFEEDYAHGRDYDPDRDAADQRRLKRKLARERRGAMRELRKDASFMSAVRDMEKARVDGERMASQKKFYSELQALDQDLKSGGQKGMNPHLKKKKRR